MTLSFHWQFYEQRLSYMSMLSRTKVINALEKKREQFAQYQRELRAQADLRSRLLARFMAMESETIAAQVKASGQEWPGALPTPEIDRAEALRISLGEGWRSHQEARRWALAVLEAARVRSHIEDAVRAAHARAMELGDEFGKLD